MYNKLLPFSNQAAIHCRYVDIILAIVIQEDWIYVSFDMKRVHLNDSKAVVIVTDMYYAIVILRWL